MMTSRLEPPEDDEAATPVVPDPVRPIPDGGLGSTMPAWLLQPPAWKRNQTSTTVRSIPAPDASVIDPRSLLEIDDLPPWLQAIAGRDATVDIESSVGVESDREPSAPSEETPGDIVSHAQPRTSTSIDSRVAPPAVPESAKRPWWMSDGVIGGLLVAVILTMIYVLLVASGAF